MLGSCGTTAPTAGRKWTVIAMKVNGRPLSNNPKQAYMPDKLHGAQGTMGNVAMVPKDECGVVFGG